MKLTKKQCFARECYEDVGDKHGCLKHWKMLPSKIRHAINNAADKERLFSELRAATCFVAISEKRGFTEAEKLALSRFGYTIAAPEKLAALQTEHMVNAIAKRLAKRLARHRK